MKTERRYIAHDFEVRSADGKTTIEGHAAVFNRMSQNLGGFVEQVAPGAFTKTIQEADVRALFNHNPMFVLGRNRSGTLDLSEDTTGLAYRVVLPDTTFARDLAISMERGDVSSSSFTFAKISDTWGFTEQDFPMRTLKEVQLIDVSPVTYPAYLDADANLAGRALEGLAESRGLSLEQVTAGDLAAVIRGEVAAEEAPADEGRATPTLTVTDLSVYKARLRLKSRSR